CPSNPLARFATADLASKVLAKSYEEHSDGQMPDGAVIISAITSCTNTSNPRNLVAAPLLARKANRHGLQPKPWVKSSFAP
ncbi:aconitase family protein, partial [Neisseria sp. P0001.S006]|uniref:aconitase family protein n=1 Tax=Neisseria sp. P0001.S006 TaxID=3436650 RepID=UPI003F7EA231